jgi:hypothetical protein
MVNLEKITLDDIYRLINHKEIIDDSRILQYIEFYIDDHNIVDENKKKLQQALRTRINILYEIEDAPITTKLTQYKLIYLLVKITKSEIYYNYDRSAVQKIIKKSEEENYTIDLDKYNEYISLFKSIEKDIESRTLTKNKDLKIALQNIYNNVFFITHTDDQKPLRIPMVRAIYLLIRMKLWTPIIPKNISENQKKILQGLKVKYQNMKEKAWVSTFDKTMLIGFAKEIDETFNQIMNNINKDSGLIGTGDQIVKAAEIVLQNEEDITNYYKSLKDDVREMYDRLNTANGNSTMKPVKYFQLKF